MKKRKAITAESMAVLVEWLGTKKALDAFAAAAKTASPGKPGKLTAIRAALRVAGLDQLERSHSDAELITVLDEGRRLAVRGDSIREIASMARMQRGLNQILGDLIREAQGAMRFLRIAVDEQLATEPRRRCMSNCERVLSASDALMKELDAVRFRPVSLPTVEQLTSWNWSDLESEPTPDREAARRARDAELATMRAEAVAGEQDAIALKRSLQPKRGRPKAGDDDRGIHDLLVSLGASKAEATNAIGLTRNALNERRARRTRKA